MSKEKESRTRLVWSDDPRDKVDQGRKVEPETEVVGTSWTAVFRLEKNGRGGKTVTVLDQLPRNTAFVKQLCKDLKSQCGSGGTFEVNERAGVIEIQGDKRDVMKSILTKKGIKYKGM